MGQAVTEAERRTLKTAFRRLWEACGGIDAAAAACRVGRSHLARASDQNCPESFATVDVVARLEQVAGLPIVTEVLAAAAGYVLVAAQGGDRAMLGEELMQLSKDAGQTMCDALDCLRRGADDGNCLRTLRDDLAVLARVTMAASAAVHAMIGDDARGNFA
jgi:hypothetical protein